MGESEKAVVRALGPPRSTLALRGGKLARYRLHGGLFIVTYDATGHVASLETYSSYYRTAGGVGPGSSVAKAAALPGFHADFCELGYWNGTATTSPSDLVTVFTPNGGLVASVLITQLRLYTACDTGGREITPKAGLALNRSIGGVSIGMTESSVVGRFGAPASTLMVTLGGGSSGKSVRYRIHGAPFLLTYDSSGRVVSLEAYAPFFRTVGGVGPGASIALVRKLHGFRADFCELGYWNGTPRTRPDQVVTVFTPNGGRIASVLITELRLYTPCAAGGPELPPEA
jgi:hypothetical protein